MKPEQLTDEMIDEITMQAWRSDKTVSRPEMAKHMKAARNFYESRLSALQQQHDKAVELLKLSDELKDFLQDKADNLKTELDEFELIAAEYFDDEEWNSDYQRDLKIYNQLTAFLQSVEQKNNAG